MAVPKRKCKRKLILTKSSLGLSAKFFICNVCKERLNKNWCCCFRNK